MDKVTQRDDVMRCFSSWNKHSSFSS